MDDAFYRGLFDHLGFICIAVDQDLRICAWNDRAAAHFGESIKKLTGQPAVQIFPEPDRPNAERLLRDALESNRSGEMEVRYPGPADGEMTFAVIISPVFSADGSCRGVSLSMGDISERRRLSRESAKSRRLTSLGNMAKGVAHHFNNILGGMLTSIEFVLASDSPRELRRTLRLLAEQIGRATRITRQLEAFAASEHEKAQWRDLNRIMADFVQWASSQAQRAKAQIVSEIDQVESDPFESQRLLRVLESLAQNSLDAMGEGGTLTVGLKREDEEAVITIGDTGCGIPEEVLERVFEPFFTTKGEFGGGPSDNIGLGLAAVHGLVAEMGGRIEIQSKVGVGTSAIIHLPLRREQAGAEAMQLSSSTHFNS